MKVFSFNIPLKREKKNILIIKIKKVFKKNTFFTKNIKISYIIKQNKIYTT